MTGSSSLDTAKVGNGEVSLLAQLRQLNDDEILAGGGA